MKRLALGSVIALATPLALLGCGDSGSSDAQTPFGGAGGDAGSGGTSTAGTSQGGSTSGGSAGAAVGGSTNGGAAGDGGSGSGGSGNGGSGNGGSGTQDAGIPDVAFTYDAPVIVEEACAATRIEADPIPLDMYIVLDDSGSMGPGDCSVTQTGTSKWCRAVASLWGFFNAPSSVGMGVAINYFNNGAVCGTGLTNPPGGGSVALNTLPAHLSSLATSLNAEGPSGGTPIEAALRSIVSFTSANQRPGRQMIGILITDGAPGPCATANNTLHDIAANHFNATGIPTFMVGMTGAVFASLENWANGSGSAPHPNYCGSGLSSPCYSFDVGNGDPTVFINTLRDIQKAAIGCTFNIPTPPTGIPDITKIKVIYSSGGTSETLVRVTDSTQCAGSPGSGWYFNDNANPTQILLCPDTCTRVSGDQNAQIDVEIPCLGS